MQVFLCGYYGYGNAGDEALLATLLQMLPPQAQPVVLSGHPAQTQALHGVQTCDRKHPLQVLQTLWSSQAFIWGGGSLIQDATSVLSPLYYLGLMSLAQQRGLITIAWAQGVGPLHRPWIRWVTRQVFRGCTAISVRDRASAALVTQWGLTPILAPDPVWALQASAGPNLTAVPSPRVAVILRPHPLLTAERLETLTQALRQFHAQTQAHLLLLPLQLSQDLPLAQALEAQLLQAHIPASILSITNPAILRGLFTQIDLVIAMRLHGLIMAAAAGCRCSALSYDPKVSQLMQEMPCPGWELDALPPSPATLATLWHEQLMAPAVPPATAQSRCNEALQHQQLLARVLAP